MFVVLLFGLLGSAQAAPTRWDPTPKAARPAGEVQELLNGNRLSAARKAAEKAIAADPECGVCHLLLGIVQLRQNAPDAARETVKPVVKAFGDRAEVHSLMANIEFAAQDWEAAEAASLRALAIEPYDLQAMTSLTMVAMRTGDIEPTLAKVRAGEKKGPGKVMACMATCLLAEADRLDEMDAALGRCEDSGDANWTLNARNCAAGERGGASSVTRFDDRVKEAQSLLDSAQYAEAEALLERLLAKRPEDLRLRQLYALSLYNQAKLDLALPHFKLAFTGQDWIHVNRTGYDGILTKSAERAAQSSRAYAAALYVVTLVRLERVDEAEQELVRIRGVLGASDDYLDAAEVLLLSAQGRTDQAWAKARTLVKTETAQSLLGLAVEDLERRDPKAADQAVVSAVLGDDPVTAAFGAYRREDWAACVRHAQRGDADPRLVEVGVHCAITQNQLGVAQELMGRLPVEERKPEQILNLAGALFNDGQYAQVRSTLDTLQDDLGEELGGQADALRFHTSVKQEDWDGALRNVSAPGIAPANKVYVAVELAMAKRELDRAVALLVENCPLLEAEADRQRCKENLEILQEGR